MNAHFLTPKAHVVVRGERLVSVAITPILAGETVAAFGGGCISGATLAALPPDQQGRSIQIDEDLYMAGSVFADGADMVQHSCSPNCGIVSGVLVVAMNNIGDGDELTCDYAMTDGSVADEFECRRGTAAKAASDRVRSTRVDASDAADIVELARTMRADIIVNACDPRLNPPIFDAAFEAGCHYLDMAMHMSTPHPTNPYSEPGVMLGDAQFAVADQWTERGQLALSARLHRSTAHPAPSRPRQHQAGICARS